MDCTLLLCLSAVSIVGIHVQGLHKARKVKQDNDLKLCQGTFRYSDIRKKNILRNSGSALEQSAQGGGGVIIPGGV